MTASNGNGRPSRRGEPLPRWFTATAAALILACLVALLLAGVVWVWQAIL